MLERFMKVLNGGRLTLLLFPWRKTIKSLEQAVVEARADEAWAVMQAKRANHEVREVTQYLNHRLQGHREYTNFDLHQLAIPVATASAWVPVGAEVKEDSLSSTVSVRVFTVEKRWVPIRMTGQGEKATGMEPRERTEVEQLLYEAIPYIRGPAAKAREHAIVIEIAKYFMRHNTYPRKGGNR